MKALLTEALPGWPLLKPGCAYCPKTWEAVGVGDQAARTDVSSPEYADEPDACLDTGLLASVPANPPRLEKGSGALFTSPAHNKQHPDVHQPRSVAPAYIA